MEMEGVPTVINPTDFYLAFLDLVFVIGPPLRFEDFDLLL
jgi:hypothetical protein